MSKKLLKYDIIGFVFVSIIGTLAHFVYEWTNECVIAAFSARLTKSLGTFKTNLLSYLIWTVIQALYEGYKKSFACQNLSAYLSE